jgi:hypothetical protein
VKSGSGFGGLKRLLVFGNAVARLVEPVGPLSGGGAEVKRSQAEGAEDGLGLTTSKAQGFPRG